MTLGAWGARRLTRATAVALVVLGLSTVSARAGTVTGTVKNSVTNAVISGVTVKVVQQAGKQANTNASGVYSITGVTAGSKTLEASKTGFLTQTTGAITVPASGTVTAPLILLVKAGTITGKVVNASGGAAVASATVTITGTSTTATTNTSGNFTLYAATGTYTLTITKTGWVTRVTSSFAVTNNQTTALGNIQLTQAGTVTGTVRDALTNALLAGVTVSLHGNPAITTTTNASGVFTLAGVPVGAQTLDLAKTGYVNKTTGTITVTSGTTNAGTILLDAPTGTITGAVTDAHAGGAPLEGVTVSVNGVTPAISTTTAPDGTYALAAVPVGDRTVHASMTGYVEADTGAVTVTHGQSADAGPLALARTTVTVSGTVRTSGSGAPIADADVAVQEQPGASATTDGDGAYAISGVVWGDVHLVVSASGHTGATLAVTLSPETGAVQDVELAAALGTITGQVVDAATGLGLLECGVHLTADPGRSTGTDWEGRFTLTDVPAGSHTVTATRNDFAEATGEPIAVVEGETSTAPPLAIAGLPATITGIVRDAPSGDPIEGATVTAARSGATAVTDASGVYTLSGLAAGYEVVAASFAGRPAIASEAIVLHANETRGYDFWLEAPSTAPPGIIHGTVRDSAGSPLAGATVTVVGLTAVQTASDGTYAVTAPPGRYAVMAGGAGFRTILFGHHGGASLSPQITWQLRQDFVLPTTSETATITLTTTDAITLSPVQGRGDLAGVTGLFLATTSPEGTRTFTVPAGPLFVNRPRPRILAAGESVALDVTGGGTAPGTSPNWAAGGIAFRSATDLPVPDVTVTLSNAGESFTTDATTDAHGRWSVSGGPLGEYTVTFEGPGDLTAWEAWSFTATDDGALFIGDRELVAPGDPGTLAITSPAPGAVLTEQLASITAAATLVRSDDYVTVVDINLSNGQVLTRDVVYDLDGRSFRIDLTSTSGNGAEVVSVTAWTRSGGWMNATVDVDMQAPPVPVDLGVNPAEVFGTDPATGWVALSAPALAGGALVELTSSDPAVATVPPSVTISEGASSGEFPVLTANPAAPTEVTILASTGGITRTTTLTVTPTPYGSISGRVVDASTGVGLQGANVRLSTDPGLETWTDWQGAYTLLHVPVGPHSVFATRETYRQETSAEVAVESGLAAAMPDLALPPVPARITGVVRDATTGSPEPGVEVIAARSGAGVWTDAGGAYLIDDLPPGIEVLAFRLGGRPVVCSNYLTLSPGEARVVDFEVAGPSSSPAGVVHGVVRDSAGAPVEGASVALLGGPSTATAADGSYSMTASPGRHALVVRLAGFRPTFTENLGDATLYPASTWQIAQDLTLVGESEHGTLELTSSDPILRTLREGEAALWTQTSRVAAPMPTGQRTIDGVPAGLLLGWMAPRVLPAGGTLHLDFDAGVTLPGTSPNWVAGGTVLRRGSGEPVEGATVTLTNAGASFATDATTDAIGRWSFAGGPVGEYAVTVAGPGGLVAPDTWTFTAADDGGVFVGTRELVAPGDDGSLVIDAPVSGAAFTEPIAAVDITATLPRPGDFVSTVDVTISDGQVLTRTPVFALDGRHVHIDLTSTSGNGAHVVTVTAWTRFGAVLTATVPVEMHVDPVPIAVTLTPSQVWGGQTSTGTVTLNRPAAPGGTVVQLASSDPAVAAVPGEVTVSATATQATFPVTTASVTTTSTVTVSATTGGSTVGAPLTIDPVVLASLAVEPSSLTGGMSATGTVTLIGVAPPAGMTVQLSSSDPSVAGVPGDVTMEPGATQATFPVTTTSVAATATVTLTATAGPVTRTAPVTVLPAALVSLAVSPASIHGPTSATGTVSLDGVAPAGGLLVALGSSAPAVAAVPATVTVPQGASSSQFEVVTTIPATPTDVTLTAGAAGVERTATLRVLPPNLTSFSLSPTSTVNAGASVTAQVRIDRSAPAGGMPVSLASSDAEAAPVPSSVTVPAGMNQGSFTITTGQPPATTTATLTATLGPSTRTTMLTVVVPGTITGTVVSAADASPLAGAIVTVVGVTPVVAATTGGDGMFSLPVVAGGYSLSVVDPGWLSHTFGPFTVASGQTTAAGSLALTQGGLVTGLVRHMNRFGDWYGVSGATVTAEGSSITTTATPSGEFSLSLPAGDWTLTASKPDYVSGSATVAALSVGETRTANVILLHYASASGKVVDSVTLQGVNGTTVTLTEGPTPRSTTTSGEWASTGSFSFHYPAGSVAPGRYDLTVSKTGWETTTRVVVLDPDEYLNLGNILFIAQGRITGIVSGQGAGAIAGATVAITGGTGTATTDAAGAFDLWQRPGSWSLAVSAPGWAPATTAPVTVTAGQVTDAGTITLTHGGSIAGLVVNAAGGAPVEGVTVATGSGESTSTDAAGAFTLANLAPGSFTFNLTKPGWVPGTTESFTVTEGQTTDAGTLTIGQVGTLSGIVADVGTGAPLAGVAVTVVGTALSATTDGTGAFAFGELPAGTYALDLEKAGWVAATSPLLTVAGGETANAGTLYLEQLGSISGTVTWTPSGNPNVGVAVEAVGTEGSVVTDGMGAFTLPLPAGSYRLKVGSIADAQPTIVGAGQTTDVGQRLLPETGSVLLQVVTPSGHTFVPDVSFVEPVSGQPPYSSFVHDLPPYEPGHRVSLPHGTPSLDIGRHGLVPARLGPLPVAAGQQAVYVGTVSLQPAGAIMGTVRDSESLVPIQGATIAAEGTAFVTSTDTAGGFDLSATTGTYTLTVSKPGWAAATMPGIAVVTGQDTNVSFIMLTRERGTLTGTIVEADGGSPIAGATVSLNGAASATTTDAAGAFSLEVPASASTLLVRAAGHAARLAGPFEVTGGGTTQTGPLTLTSGAGTLAGTAVDATSHEPVADALVSVAPLGLQVRTGPDGAFTLALAPGSVRLEIAAGLRAMASSAYPIAPGQTMDAGMLPLAPVHGGVTGVLVDRITSTPVPGVAVALNQGGGPIDETTSDAAGRFSLVAATASGQQLSFSKTGWWIGPGQLGGFTGLVAGQTIDLGTLVMDGKGEIVGRVERNLPPGSWDYIHGADVTCDSCTAGMWTPTNWKGTFAIFTSDPTPSLTVSADGFITATTAPIAVNPGHVAEAPAIKLDKLGTMIGQVVFAGGHPAKLIRIAVDGTSIETQSGTLTLANGTVVQGGFVLAAPAGSHTLTLSGGYCLDTTRGPFTFTDNVTQQGVVLVIDRLPGYDIASLTLEPPAVTPGQAATATVTFNGPLASGVTFTIGSANPLAASVPTGQECAAGATSCTFTVTTFTSAPVASVEISAQLNPNHPLDLFCHYCTSKAATLTLLQPTVTGVAPGWLVPGSATVVAYGEGFGETNEISLEGPAYTLDNLMTPVCVVLTGACPETLVPATVNLERTALSFTLAPGLAPGLYYLQAKRGEVTSATGAWLAVDAPAKAVPVVAPENHIYAKRIWPGQTVTGTFVEAGDPEGVVGDYNGYYFIATAGSTISASLERVDTALPWEHPDSIDPELVVVAPDGFVYQNLVKYDDQPGVDLDASLTDATLPLSGLYLIVAETTRGHGSYRLTVDVTSMAPAGAGERVVPLVDNHATVPLGTAVHPVAIMLDPRGWPLSGARAAFGAVPGADDHGTVTFAETHVTTGPDGSAQTDVTATGLGKVSYAPSLETAFASGLGLDAIPGTSGVVRPDGATRSASPATATWTIPRYQPVARRPFAVSGIVAGGTIRLTSGRLEGLAFERHDPPQGVGTNRLSRRASGTGTTGPTGSQPGADAIRGLPVDRGDATTAVPLPENEATLAARAASISSCQVSLFDLGIVSSVSSNPPYSFTLTDLTANPNVILDSDGLKGYRIEKAVRLKLEIRDAAGNVPDHPVLVHLKVGGPRHGSVILDPDGTRIECDDATFLWHQEDFSGTVIAPNEVFELRLGTLARYVGAEPDPAHPGHVRPVWGAEDSLEVVVDVDAGQIPRRPSSHTMSARPQPGEPRTLVGPVDLLGHPEDDVFEVWPEYSESLIGGIASSGLRLFNVYYLRDAFNNTTFGYTNAAATSPAPNVTVVLADQLSGGPDYSGYTLDLSWRKDPDWPRGVLASTLSVSYPSDPDWPQGGVVSKPISLDFKQGPFKAVVQKQNYETPYYFDDTGFPIAATPAGNAKAIGDRGKRLVLLMIAGNSAPDDVLVGDHEPVPTGQKLWWFEGGVWRSNTQPGADPGLAIADPSATFRLSLIDVYGRIAVDGEFRVHNLPRAVHFEPPGVDVYTYSAGGAVPSISAPNGYLGMELLKAPKSPGTYFIKVESLSGLYRVRQCGHWFDDTTPAGEFSGAFQFVRVTSGEFLDQSFAAFPEGVIPASVPTIVNLRYVNASGPAPSSASITSKRQDGTDLDLDVAVALTALPGSSHEYLGSFHAVPDGFSGTVPAGRPSVRIAFGAGSLVAKAVVPQAAPAPALGTANALATEGETLAEAPTAFPGKLTVRFRTRDGCQLTPSPDGSHPELVGTEQRTEIVREPDPWSGKTRHVERVHLTVEALNPFRRSDPPQSWDGPLSIEEIRNPVYFEDRNLFQYQLFFEGYSGSSKIGGGVLVAPSGSPTPLNLTGGRVELSLTSGATVRWSAVWPPAGGPPVAGPPVQTTALTPYHALIRLKLPSSTDPWAPVPTDETAIAFWVDERSYDRAGGVVTWSSLEAPNAALDWLEARVLDYVVDPASAVATESAEVLSRVITVRDDWTIDRDRFIGVVRTSEPTIIRWHPSYWQLRYTVPDDPGGIPSTSVYHALVMSVPQSARLDRVVSHEARHCWQHQPLLQPGLLDLDGDHLPQNPSLTSPELTDAHYPTNPEFDFSGDSGSGSSDWAHPSRSTAVEHNADRFATDNARGSIACAPIQWQPGLSFAPGTPSPEVSGTLKFEDDGPLFVAYVGALVLLESAPAGTACSATSGWSHVAFVAADSNGVVGLSNPTLGRYRATVVMPRECPATVVQTCTP